MPVLNEEEIEQISGAGSKDDWIENVEADMTEVELKDRSTAFDYFEQQQQHIKQWGADYWKPVNRREKRTLLREVEKAYKKELQRTSDERMSNSDMILTDKVRISLYNGEINNNILTIAGSGRGKTYSVVLPNALQANASYVFSDPKGDLLRRCGTFLVEMGYKVRVLNLIDMANSNSYNPFHYLHTEREEEVMTLIDTIMKNTDGEKKSGDPFWDKGEQLFVQSVFFYMMYELRKEERSIPKALEIMRMAEVKEENDNFISDYDALMLRLGYEQFDIFDDTNEAWEELVAEAESGDIEKQKLVKHYEHQKKLQERYRDNHIAYIQYKHFKAGAGKTAKSIIISAVARLAPFNLNALKNISLYDEMELDKIGEEKTALFVVLPPTNKTYEFVSGMMLTQLFSELNRCANVKYAKQGARLPIPVRFILDEFKNTGRIPMFTEILAYARSLNISIMPILQSLEQLKEMYEKEWQVILDNCSMFLFLGGIRNMDTLEYISKLVGKGTYDKKSHSITKGINGSTTLQYDKVGIDLVTPDTLQKFPKHECLLFVNGYDPVWEKTFDLSKHPNFSRSEDGGNIPYELNSEEIKHKQEMFKLYLQKINHEEDLDNPKLEFLGNTLMNVFSKVELVRHTMKKEKRNLHVEDMENFYNSIDLDEFEMYFSSDVTPKQGETTIEKVFYIESDAIKEIQKEKKRQENLIDSIYEKAFSLHVLNDEEIIELTRNAIKNQEMAFSALSVKAYSDEEVEDAFDRIANSVVLNDGDETTGGASTESSDMEENASFGREKDEKQKVQEGENIPSTTANLSTHGEEIEVETETEKNETTKKLMQQEELYRQQQTLQKELLEDKEKKEKKEKEGEKNKWNWEDEKFEKLEMEWMEEKQNVDAFDKGLDALMEDLDLEI